MEAAGAAALAALEPGRGRGPPDIARRVLGCHQTQVTRVQNALVTWRAMGLSDIARRVIGCH